MSEAPLQIDVSSMKRVELVTVSGRIDSSNVATFESSLNEVMESGGHRLVLEMSGVDYMSSAGLRAMVSALKECKRHRGDVRLANLSPRVSEVLSLAGLDSLFEAFPDSTAAVGSY